MAIYQYECKECGTQYEVEQKITDDKLTEYLCDNCHTVMPCFRVITCKTFQLKGDGWGKDGYLKNKDILNDCM